MSLMDEATQPEQLAAPVPRMYRAMLRDAGDGLPVVGNDAKSLGARVGPDLTVDNTGSVVLDGKGMSVVPAWRLLQYYRIPKRLRHLVPGASGSDATACFAFGTGPFQAGVVTPDLVLVPDDEPPPVKHGVVAPARLMSTADYFSALAATRPGWVVDES
jgi:hypothetical protein